MSEFKPVFRGTSLSENFDKKLITELTFMIVSKKSQILNYKLLKLLSIKSDNQLIIRFIKYFKLNLYRNYQKSYSHERDTDFGSFQWNRLNLTNKLLNSGHRVFATYCKNNII